MTGRTGYTEVTNGDGYDPAVDMTSIYEHFDPLIGESVATSASLPSSNNWYNRTVMAEDTGIIYICTNPAGAGTWRPVASDWIAYTPTFTNFAIGTGGVAANVAHYKYVGGDVRMKGSAFLGTSGASVGSGVSFTIPVTAVTPPFTNTYYPAGATLFDAAPATNEAVIRSNGTSTTSVALLYRNAGTPANITALLPWTWAPGDGIAYDFTYRAA